MCIRDRAQGLPGIDVDWNRCPPRPLSLSTVSVSYTHLDVYKRQVVEDSRPTEFVEGRLRGRGNLPAMFYVLTRVNGLIFINIKSWS